MKILLAYWVLGPAMDQFQQTLKAQRQFRRAFDAHQKLLVTDTPTRIKGFDVIANDQLWNGSLARMNKARNLCLDYARASGADWIILADADMLIVNPMTEFPSTGFSTVLQYHAPPGKVKFPASTPRRYGESSYFVLRRDIFLQHPFSEDYEGYGYCDTDYCWHTLWFAGVRQSPCNARAIHMWHPPRTGNRRQEAAANRSVFVRRVIQSMAGTGLPAPMDKLDPDAQSELSRGLGLPEPPAATPGSP